VEQLHQLTTRHASLLFLIDGLALTGSYVSAAVNAAQVCRAGMRGRTPVRQACFNSEPSNRETQFDEGKRYFPMVVFLLSNREEDGRWRCAAIRKEITTLVLEYGGAMDIWTNYGEEACMGIGLSQRRGRERGYMGKQGKKDL
jgi:hypothetical protein